jgi:hypothetical protein
MCFVCQEWEKQRLTSDEAMRNIGEILYSSKDQDQVDHLIDLSNRIIDKEVPLKEVDPSLDKQWTDENYGD